MDRKDFLKYSGQLAGAAALGGLAALSCRKEEKAATVGQGKSYRWKMVTTWPKNFPGLGIGAEKLAQRITEMSGGRLEVKIYAAGELVPAFESFDAVSQGTAEMGHGASYYWKGKVPEAQFFSAVPFGLNAMEMAGWIHHGGAQELWDNLYADFSLKPFTCGNTGVQMGGWFNKEINSLADYKGLKMRMPGLGGEVLRQAGATVVSLPGGEIFQALQSGTIDATEWVSPYNDLAFGFHKIARYYYWPGWHEPGTAMELIVNRKAYGSLPKDLQSIIEMACQAGYNEMLAEFSSRNNNALEQLVTKHKVQLKRFPEQVLKKFAEISRDTVAEVANQSSAAKKIYQSYLKFREQSINWNRIGEEGYSQARGLI